MELEKAAEIITQSLCKWVESSTNIAHCTINFPSVFIHYTKGVLKQTQEFRYYNYLTPLKQRNIIFNISNWEITSCKVYNTGESNPNLDRFNTLIAKKLKEYYSSLNKELEYVPAVKNEGLLSLQTINNFKF